MIDAILNGIALSTACPEAVITRVDRPLFGARRHEFVDVPGRAGSVLFAEQPGDRTITIGISLLVTSAAALRTAVGKLADWADTFSRARLILSDESGRFWDAIVGELPDVTDSGEYDATTELSFLVGPYAQDTAASSHAWSATSGVAHVWTPPDTVPGIPEFELVATGGTITSFTLNVNGATLTYALGGVGLTAGQTVTVSTLAYVLTRGVSGDPNLDGTFVVANLDMATVSGDFGTINPGSNSVTITRTGTATAVGVTARWRRRSR